MNVNPGVIRAVRGPIILITIGVLFAIDHSGGLEFQRTWPFLIIVIGLMKLLERALVGQQPANVGFQPAPPWGQQYPGGYPGFPPQNAPQNPPPAPSSGAGPVPPEAGGNPQ